MKHSKIFLGLTAALLAIGAFISAKAKFLSLPACYIKNGVCMFDPRPRTGQTLANGAQLFTTIGGAHYRLYTCVLGVPVCDNPLFSED